MVGGRMPRARGLPRDPHQMWHGALGRAVQQVAPATEADPVAILVQALALFGALCGNGPWVRVGGIPHKARIWPLVVGRTSAGRKGTSLFEAEQLVRRVSSYAENYLRERVVQGLSSGEGLLAALGAAPAAKDGTEPPPEALAADGKLTVVETEFARVLAAAKREANTLGQVLRQLWESDRAGVMTRQSPLHVDHAHLTVIAHITPGELKLKLGDADVVGGTLNRFLLVAAERTQLLPHEMVRPDLDWLRRELEPAAEHARGVSEVRLDQKAEKLWVDVYGALCADEPDGQLGAVLARGPAYVRRLAMLYALADGDRLIGPAHLLAGLAVWHYAAESARLHFADARRRDDAERLVDFLTGASGGRTGTEIYADLFGRNLAGNAIKAMIGRLVDRGDVAVETDHNTGGRPVTRYLWTGAPRDAVAELLEYHHATSTH